jgi:hypothetical protein
MCWQCCPCTRTHPYAVEISRNSPENVLPEELSKFLFVCFPLILLWCGGSFCRFRLSDYSINKNRMGYVQASVRPISHNLGYYSVARSSSKAARESFAVWAVAEPCWSHAYDRSYFASFEMDSVDISLTYYQNCCFRVWHEPSSSLTFIAHHTPTFTSWRRTSWLNCGLTILQYGIVEFVKMSFMMK